MSKNGRPPRVFTPQETKQVLKMAARLSKGQLADFFGVSENTFREIEKRQPEVSEAYKKGRAIVIDEIAESLIEKAKGGSEPAAMFFLKTQAGWREKDKDSGDKQPVTINLIKPDDAD